MPGDSFNLQLNLSGIEICSGNRGGSGHGILQLNLSGIEIHSIKFEYGPHSSFN